MLGMPALPGARDALERVMAAHMLVQIPLLAVAGALMAAGLSPEWKARIAAWNERGISRRACVSRSIAFGGELKLAETLGV